MLEKALINAVDGEIRSDAGSLAAYAHDSSNYRKTPILVVVPHTVEAGAAAVRVCHEHGVPVLSRGGGTSLAGQCCNEAVVIDWSKYCNRVVEVNTARRTALVEPGLNLDHLNERLKPLGLMVGPKPSTHDTCTIGGMIGNNSCGASAQAYGKMADSVVRLDVLTYDGARFWAGETPPEEYARIVADGGRVAEIVRSLRRLRDDNLALVRKRFPDIPRRISGYNLDSLLPEKGFHLGRFLTGTESTLVTILRAEISLVEVPPAQALLILGYPDVGAAGDAVPRITPHRPLALEGLDEVLVGLAREEHMAGLKIVHEMPEGRAWLMVRFGGATQDEAEGKARRLCEELAAGPHPHTSAVMHDPAEEERLWKLREAGLGATAYPPHRADTHEGWEDAAVPPDRLGDYLRDFRALIEEFDYGDVSLYGHFGQGCVHTRIPFDLLDPEGVHKYRRFAERAARLVASYGGSLSGEHGDGQSRGELLPIMFGDDVVGLFERVKMLFDPEDRMNPGKVTFPRRLDDDLDRLDYHPPDVPTYFDYPEDDHHFGHAAARCVGVGMCRSESGGVMCPSYRATREERHTTRGRSRILQEMMRGETITDGWRSEAVLDALDLCLACKGCKQDCPVNVDMATYKAEFLAHHYARRLRPASHYSMGWLPLWARLASAAPKAANALAHAPLLGGLAKRAAGVDPRRELPAFADTRLIDWFKNRPSRPGVRGPVVLWPDTFTSNLHPHIGRAAVTVLEDAGFSVHMPPVALCCGLTWISTGQLGTARRVLARTARALAPRLRHGIKVVGLEPSCTAVFRSDAPELLPDDGNVSLLASGTRTLSEFLWENDALPEPRDRPPVLVQPHCHQHAVLGTEADQTVMRAAAGGREPDILDAGCCGLAGNFGFERGHYDVSEAVAEYQVLPAVRAADPGTAILADGFSCRTQIADGTSAEPLHLAEWLARR